MYKLMRRRDGKWQWVGVYPTWKFARIAAMRMGKGLYEVQEKASGTLVRRLEVVSRFATITLYPPPPPLPRRVAAYIRTNRKAASDGDA